MSREGHLTGSKQQVFTHKLGSISNFNNQYDEGSDSQTFWYQDPFILSKITEDPPAKLLFFWVMSIIVCHIRN